MKSFRKFLTLMGGALLLTALVTACGGGNNSDPEPEEAKYSISFNEDLDNLSVTAGEEITLTVASIKGSWSIDTENASEAIELSSENDADGNLSKITIKGVSEAAAATFTIYPTEAGSDNSYDKTISVKVIDPNFTFTLTLSDELAEQAATISVTHKNGDVTYTGIVDYTANASSAAVTFVKANADDWYYFSNISVSILDAEGNAVKSQFVGNNYFAYTDTSFTGLSVEAWQAQTMPVTFTFAGFTPASFSVTYGLDDDTQETVAATLADDKASATINVSNAYANASNYMQIISVQALDDSNAEIEVEMTSESAWFEFSSSKTDTAFAYSIVGGYTELSKTESCSISATAVDIDVSGLSADGVSVSSILIEASDCDWTSVSGSWWIYAEWKTSSEDEEGNVTTSTKGSNISWVDNTYYKATITDATSIAEILAAGTISITGSDGLSATITVSYK